MYYLSKSIVLFENPHMQAKWKRADYEIYIGVFFVAVRFSFSVLFMRMGRYDHV